MQWEVDRWEEMLLLVCLLPLLASTLSAPFGDILGCSDASSVGLGVSEARLTNSSEAQKLATHASLRGDYTTLDDTLPGRTK